MFFLDTERVSSGARGQAIRQQAARQTYVWMLPSITLSLREKDGATRGRAFEIGSEL